MKEPGIISRKRILEAFFAVEEVEIENNGGEETLRRHLVVPKEAVAVILYKRDTNTLIFSKQYRFAVGEWLLEIPAGVMDNHKERPEETAVRECMEETGYSVTAPEFVVTFFSSPGITSEKIHLFYAEVEAKDKIAKGGGLDNENENIKVVEIPFGEALKMVENGEINDGKTLLAILWLDNYLQRKNV